MAASPGFQFSAKLIGLAGIEQAPPAQAALSWDAFVRIRSCF
jgi:hypothetical protein